jgi:hypothetical protein
LNPIGLSQSSISGFEHPPPPSRGSESSRNFTPRKPATEKGLRRQASSIKALLRTRSRSPPSPSDRALNQLVKGFRLTMQGAILLAKENTDLRAANEKQKQKRARSRRQIPAEEGLSVQEASQLISLPSAYLEDRLFSHVYGASEGVGYADCQGIEEKPVIDQLVSLINLMVLWLG